MLPYSAKILQNYSFIITKDFNWKINCSRFIAYLCCVLFSRLCLVPVSSASAERRFLRLKLINTYSRSSKPLWICGWYQWNRDKNMLKYSREIDEFIQKRNQRDPSETLCCLSLSCCKYSQSLKIEIGFKNKNSWFIEGSYFWDTRTGTQFLVFRSCRLWRWWSS